MIIIIEILIAVILLAVSAASIIHLVATIRRDWRMWKAKP